MLRTMRPCFRASYSASDALSVRASVASCSFSTGFGSAGGCAGSDQHAGLLGWGWQFDEDAALPAFNAAHCLTLRRHTNNWWVKKRQFIDTDHI